MMMMEEESEAATMRALPVIMEAEEITKLKGQDLEELQEAFSLFDIDGNGVVSMQEIAAVMKSIGMEYSDEDINEMIHIVDKDEDGEIGFDDFHDLMKETILRGVQEDDMKRTFNVFDTDGDGYITPNELHILFTNLGENVNINEAAEILEEADADSDGLLDFKDFKAYFEKQKKKPSEEDTEEKT
eukprot:gene20133-22106_t